MKNALQNNLMTLSKRGVMMVVLMGTFFFNLWGNNELPTSVDKVEESNLENYLEGRVLGEELLVNFNISQVEFNTIIEQEAIQKLTIDFFWKSKDGQTIQGVDSVVIDNITYLFDIEGWSHQIFTADTLDGYYLAQVAINEAACGPRVEVPIVIDVIEEEEVDLPIELPDYECGDVLQEYDLSNEVPLAALASGDIIFVARFPVLLETVNGGGGNFSGTGIIPLPFGKKVVKVEFDNIFVNEEYKVKSGEVHAISDNPANYPDFTVAADTFSIGGDICIPPPPPPGYDQEGFHTVTGLDAYGFGQDSLHSITGTKYDRDSFDIAGNYLDTEQPYNPQGCDRAGMDREGNPCDPSAGSNPKSEEFAESVAGTIGNQVQGIINELLTEYQDSLSKLDCSSIRTEVDGLVGDLQYDRLFIFGEGDKYLIKGMHQEFESEPQILSQNDVDRKPKAKELEQRHVDLYHCDKNEYVLGTYIDALNTLKNDTELETSLLETISNWGDYNYNKYADDPTAFAEWLRQEIERLMQAQSNLGAGYTSVHTTPSLYNSPTGMPQGWGSAPKSKLQKAFEFERGYDFYNATASLSESYFNAEFTLEDAAFEFLQGAQYINGVDRAYYLEGLAHQQYFNPDEANANLQPIAVSKVVGNRSYTIYLDNMVFHPDGAVLDAYALIEDPESQRKLAFRGLGIAFGPTGLQGESSLSLGVDIELRLNNAAKLIIKGTEGTRVTWDCDGFKSVSLSAEIEFCREYIIPLDASLNPLPDPERYRLQLDIQEISGWLEFYTVVNAPPFAVAGAEDVKWELVDMVLDFSSSETPQFIPIEGYASPFLKGNVMEPGWKGFYMESLTASFPNEFSNTTEPITAAAEKVLIDECGFSGGVSVENLVSIENGNIGGWAFSINKFGLKILKNQFGGAAFGGEINVPVFEEDMAYTAQMYPGSQYSFTVEPKSSLTADVFLAEVELYEESKVKIGKIDGEFLAVATLTGKLRTKADGLTSGQAKLEFPELCFQNFEVSNQAPYFSPGKWGIIGGDVDISDVAVEAKFAGFGTRLSNITPYSNADKEVGIGFDMDIELVGELGISAHGRIGIEGQLEETSTGQQKWVHKGMDIGGLGIDASFPGASIVGYLEWYDEATGGAEWGSGFRGVLDAQFESFDLGLKAAAQFGKKSDYKYFFVDALADLGVGIGTGALQLKGFGGGISYHMDAVQNEVNYFNTSGDFAIPAMGHSFSGTQYTPNAATCLGLKAAVIVAAYPREEVFNGTASFNIAFNCNNGIGKIGLQGSGQFLTPINLDALPGLDFIPAAVQPPSTVDASLAAYMDLVYNFDEPSFHGDLNVFLNAADGRVIGAGHGGKMVDAELHFDPEKWYIHIGRPLEGQRAGMQIIVPGIGNVHADAYMQIGTETDAMPAPPEEVSEIAYKLNRNESLRRSGGGFVLGASLGFDMKAEIAKVVSAELKAKGGFDMMLRKYEGVSCEGREGPVGIDGWYASGQMYAYVYGQLKAFGVNVAEAGIAAILQARLPNPFFAQATVGVKLKMAFVKVKKSLKLTLGEDCILQSDDPNAALGMEVISFLNPSDGQEKIETHIQPEAYFNMALDRPYTIPDLNGNEQSYTAKLVSSELVDDAGNTLGHTFKYNEDKTAINIIPNDVLPEGDSLIFTVTVSIFQNGDYLMEEVKSVTFATDEALGYIPELNVKAAYPANGMVNFYKNEYNRQEGYIQLVSGQSNLFDNLPEGTEPKVRLTESGTGKVSLLDVTYNGEINTITYPLSGAILQADQLYKLEIIHAENMGSGTSNLTSSPPDASSNVAAEDSKSATLYTLYFRVSDYGTFGEKMTAIMNGSTSGLPTKKGIIRKPVTELFDELEKEGTSKYDPLMTFTVETQNSWIQGNIDPVLEELRLKIHCGTPPSLDVLEYAAGINGNVTSGTISQDNFTAGAASIIGRQQLSFELEKEVDQLVRLHKDLLIDCAGGSMNSFLADCQDSGSSDCTAGDTTYPAMPSGAYEVLVEYRLPGGITTTNTTIDFIK